MIDWKNIKNEKPTNDTMVLIFDVNCLTTQAYWSGHSFHEPWGNEYPGSKQPTYWAEMNMPNVEVAKNKLIDSILELDFIDFCDESGAAPTDEACREEIDNMIDMIVAES